MRGAGSLLERDVTSQPGFATLTLNNSGAYISPVAQVMAHMASAARAVASGGAAVVTVPQLAAPSTGNLTVLGRGNLTCLQSVAVCDGVAAATLFVLNRCGLPEALNSAHGSPLLPSKHCGSTCRAVTAWTYQAKTASNQASMWASLPLTQPAAPETWGKPVAPTVLAGQPSAVAAFSLTILRYTCTRTT